MPLMKETSFNCNIILLPTSVEAGYIHDLVPGTRDPYRDPYQVRNYKKKQRNRAGADDTKEVDIVLGVLSDALNVINPDLDKIADRIVSCFDKGNCNVGKLIEKFGDSVRIIPGNDISAEDILLFSEGKNINKQSLTGFSRAGSLAAIVGSILGADELATRINKDNFQVNIDSPISSLFGPNEITIGNTKSKFNICYESTRVYLQLPCDPKILNWFVRPFFKQQLLSVNDSNDKYYTRNKHLEMSTQAQIYDVNEKESFRAVLATERSIRLDLVVRLCVLLLVSPVLLFFSILGILVSSVYKIQQTFCKSKQNKFYKLCDKRCEDILSITKQISQNRIEKKVDSLLPETLICDEGGDSEYSRLRLYLKTFPKESIKGLDALKQYMHFLDDFLPEIKKSYFDSDGNFRSDSEKVWVYSRASKYMCKHFKHRNSGVMIRFMRGLVQVLALPIRISQAIYKASMNTKCAKRKLREAAPWFGYLKTEREKQMSGFLKAQMKPDQKTFSRCPGAKAQIEDLINNPDKIKDYDSKRAKGLFNRLNTSSSIVQSFYDMSEQDKKENYIFKMLDKLIPEIRHGEAQVRGSNYCNDRRLKSRMALHSLCDLAREDSSVEESQRTMYV